MASDYNVVARAWSNAADGGSIFDRVNEVSQQRQKNAVADAWRIRNTVAEQVQALPALPEVDGYALAQMKETGYIPPEASQIDRDFATLDANAFRQRYGSALGEHYSKAYALGSVQFSQRARPAERSNLTAVGDFANTTVSTPVSTLGGIVSLGLGGAGYAAQKLGADTVGDSLARGGATAADLTGDFTNWAQSFQSDGMKTAREDYAVETAKRAQNYEAQYQSDRSQFGDVVAKALKIGQGFYDGVAALDGNAPMVTDTIANAIGSLGASGIISKGLRKVGTAVVSAVGDGVAVQRAARIAKAAEMPASVTAMEAGGAYQQTVEAALQELSGRTDLTDAQKQDMANKAGLEAAAIQGAATAVPMGVPGLRRVFNTKFESSPISISDFGKIGRTLRQIGAETLEEGYQEGSAQAAQNKAIQDQINPNVDIASGVGEAGALGAIGGLGSAGAFKAPGLSVAVPVAGVKAAGNGVASLVRDFMGRGSTQQAPQETPQGSPVSDAGVAGTTSAPEAPVASPEAAPGNSQANPAPKQERSSITQGQIYVDPILDTRWDGDQRRVTVRDPQTGELTAEGNIAVDKYGNLGPVTLFDPKSGDPLNPNRADAEHIREMASKAPDMSHLSNVEVIKPEDVSRIESIHPDAKVEAVPGGLASLNQGALDTLRSNGTDIVATINPETKAPEMAVINPAVLAPTTDANHPSTKAAAQGLTDFTPQALADTLKTAETAPEKVNPDQADKLLFHADDGKVNLSPAQRVTLRTASATARAVQKASTEANKSFGLPNADQVSKEILTKPAKDGSELGKKSIIEHLADFRAAVAAGDTEQAKAVMAELNFFAEHMANKLDAVNRAVTDGHTSSANPARYQSYVGGGRFRVSGKIVQDANGNRVRQATGIHVSLKSANSVALAQRIAVEANTVYEVVNNLATAFPDLGSNPVVPPALNAALQGDAKQIAEAQKAEQASEQSLPAAAQPAEATPEPAQAAQETAADAPVSQTDTNEPVVANEAPVVDSAPVDGAVAVEPAVDAVQKRSLKSLFSALIGTTDNANRIQSAFELPAEAATRTEGVEQPLQAVSNALLDRGAFERFINGKLNRDFGTVVAAAYSEYLKVGDVLLSAVNDSLRAFLSKNEGSKHSLVSSTSWINGQALNIVEEHEGQYRYNPALIQGAILAALNWYQKLSQSTGNLDENDVRQLLRLPSDAVLPSGLVDQINNSGVGSAELSRSLAREIQRFWGLNQNPSTPRNHAEGVLEAVAKEILTAMTKPLFDNGKGNGVGFFVVNEVPITDVTTNEKIDHINRYSLTLDEVGEDGTLRKGQRIFEDERLKAFPNAIETAVLVEPEQVTFVGEPPKTVAKTQLRNSAVPLSAKQQKAIEIQQNVPHLLNMPYINLLATMTEDMVLRLFGGGKLDPEKLNAQHMLSLKGRNLTIQSAYRSIRGMLAEARVLGDPAEVPVYFAYDTTVVNRQQMMGRDNPQSNKLMREAVLPTWHTLDLTDPKMNELFRLGLAQALGIKVHTQSREASLNELAAKLDGFKETIKLLDSKKLDEAAIDTMKAEGIDSPVALHAVLEWSRAQKAENPKAFRTAVYFEADGVTNGVVNAMALFSSGSFTGKWLSNIARGGYWVGEQLKSLADLRGDFARGEEDLYALAGRATTAAINKLRSEYSQNGAVSKQFDAVRDVLSQFLEDVNVNDGQGLDIARGAVKNPLTITIYGSGANGIAGNVVDEVVGKIYEMLSEAAARKAENPKLTEAQTVFGGDEASAQIKFDRLMENLSRLAGTVLVTQKGVLYADTQKAGVANTFGDPTKFKFSPEVIKNMRQNVLHAYVNPMVEGITETVGADLMNTLHVLKTQVQAWSIIGRAAYRQAYAKALAAKNFKSKNDILSIKEEAAVLRSVMDKLPKFDASDMSFLFGMTQRAEGNTEFGRDFAENFKTPAWGYTPGNAGVAGIPGMTIGSGDGQAVLNAVNDPEMPKGFLQIFDGIHSSVAEMEQMGKVANRAVFNSWQNNPMAKLAEAFSNMVSNLDVSALELTEEDRKDLTKSLFSDWYNYPTREDAVLAAGLKAFASKGIEMGNAISERQAVMARVQSSVDQMAGAASPHQNLGVILSGSPDQKAAMLEIMRSQKLGQEEAPAPAPAQVEAPKLSFKAASVPLLGKLLEKQITKITNDRLTRALLRDVIRSGSVDEFTVHVGTREELLSKAVEMGITVPASRSGFMGFMDPSSKSIFVVNGNPETMLHELIHAATYARLQAYYDGTDTSPELREAVKRLEALMEQFKNLGSASLALEEDPEARAEMLKERIRNFSSEGLKERFESYGISSKVILKIVNTLANRGSGIGGVVEGFVPPVLEDGKRIIELARDMASDPKFILDHEVVHVMRRLGLFSDQEWKTLVKTATSHSGLMSNIKSRYAGFGPVVQIEEAVADLFALYRRNPEDFKKAFSESSNIFKKLITFLGDLFNNVFSKKPKKLTTEQIFEQMISGELGKRDSSNVLFQSEASGIDAYQAALDEMERQASVGNQAGELNEFMAWALANADLAQQLKATKASPAARLARSVVQAIKRLIFGGKRSFAVKDDMFSNLRFNTNIVMRSGNLSQSFADGILFHDPNFGNDNRIADLIGRVKAKIGDYGNVQGPEKVRRANRLNPALSSAARVARAFQAAGFNMTKQQETMFIYMATIMATDARLDANSTVRLQEVFNHVSKHLSIDDFLLKPEENDPNDIEQASKKMEVLLGKFRTKKDNFDRSFVLPAFVALSATDEQFRQILKNIPMPKTEYAAWNSVDNILDNIGGASMDNLSRWVSGEGIRSAHAQEALDNLMEQMVQTNADNQLFIEKFTNPVGDGIDRVNQAVVDGVKWLGSKTGNLVQSLKENRPESKVALAVAQSLDTAVKLLNEEDGKAAATGLMGTLNGSKLWEPVYNLLKDMIGRTAENGEIYDMIKIARTWVNGIRQQFREQLPNIINGKFSRKLSDAEQAHLHQGLGQTGLASLLSSMSIDQVLDVLANQASRDVAVKNLIDRIVELSPKNAGMIEQKAKDLAGFMIHKKTTSNNLLRNATAIAHLLNETTAEPVNTSSEMIEAIDHLVSLLAVNELSDKTKASLADLAQNESKGMNFMLSYLRGQDELDKPKFEGNAKFNHWKGYMPSERAAGVSLSVLHLNGGEPLLKRGYENVGLFAGSSRDPSAKDRAYFFLPVSGNAPFAQGIMQNVHQTASGVDRNTGFSLDLTAGEITDPDLVKKISQNRKAETGNALLPVYDENGTLFAYERSVDPALVQQYLKPDLNMAKMMGIRSGRQSEEASANQLNKTLIDALRTMYDKDRKAGRQNEYINLTQTTDPIHKDAMRIFSKETKDYIKARFPEGFMVRRDMVDDAIGYRNASIGDVFTGNSRWSPEVQALVRNALVKMFGNNAYKYAIKAESLVQNFVMDARVILVVKSIIVPMANAASNVYQLIGRGVPATQVFKAIPKKIAEIESWHKSRVRQIEAEAELLATTDVIERRRLEAEIQTIKDSHKRLSIWPLLEAGEFSHISDAGSREDIALSEGRLGEYIEKAVGKLPDSVKTLGRYYVLAKDTALFRALQKSVAYGDFVAKAVLFDDLTQRKGQSTEQALTQITEEFVNYDRLPGRDRAYVENIGLLWFYNFKLRSAKVALSMIRNNPVHSLMAASLPMPVRGTGLPLTDNLWYSLFENKLGWSTGFGMAVRAPSLLPVHQFIW